MPYTLLSDIRGRRLTALLEKGLSQKQAAQALGLSHSIVSKMNVRFMELGTLKNRPRQNRQRAIIEQQDRFIDQIARSIRTVSYPKLQRQLLQATYVQCFS